jgi:hypothetical protein
MSRGLFWLSVTVLAFGSAHAADISEGYRKAPHHGRLVAIEKEPDLLFTPSQAFPQVHFPPHTPILLGSATLPGYYGSNHSYDYQGPYYGGENIDFRFRLPYACGVLGYC